MAMQCVRQLGTWKHAVDCGDSSSSSSTTSSVNARTTAGQVPLSEPQLRGTLSCLCACACACACTIIGTKSDKLFRSQPAPRPSVVMAPAQ